MVWFVSDITPETNGVWITKLMIALGELFEVSGDELGD